MDSDSRLDMLDTDAIHALGLLWGKAAPDVPGGWHPALLHMLDVAAVSLELLESGAAPALKRSLRAPAGGSALQDAEIAFCVACHDMGKLSPGFQAKVPQLAARLPAAGLDLPPRAEGRHARATADLLPGLLVEIGVEDNAAYQIAVALGAHHGQVSLEDPLRSAQRARYGNDLWREVRRAAVRQLSLSLGADPTQFVAPPGDGWAMTLAGLTVVCDWIGSDPDHFPYAPHEAPTSSYVAQRRRRAADVLERLGWRGWHPRSTPPVWSQVFPGFTPNPMQRAVAEVVTDLPAPGLLLVEAATGTGKTEAALFAAEHQIARFGLGGMYVALPTQATSNQMLGRVRDFLAARYDAAHVNLHLLHALSFLNPDYARLRGIRASSVDTPGSEGAVVADSWFSGKRRGLLSPFAVGTVDQAMLAALQSRFFQLRMLGLAHKVLIIDEVHAYDTFMSRILDRLLAWLSEMGAAVVLLSATLPAARRQELMAAWGACRDDEPPGPYPRVTSAVPGQRPRTTSVPGSGGQRDTTLRWCADDPTAVARLLSQQLAAGGCAAWVCNTVGAAQAAYTALRASGWPLEDLVLFHARFPVEERLRLEAVVLDRLSKRGERPRRLVVIATQVIEQSLDLDFDLMVSQLAPVDLLLQRAGRVHRHPARDPSRPLALRTRILWIACDVAPSAPLAFGPSKHVYHPHILLRSWWCLRHREMWTVPRDSDDLLDAVYAPSSPPRDCPERVATAWRETASDLGEHTRRAAAAGSTHLLAAPSAPGDEDCFLEKTLARLHDPDERPDAHPDVLARTRDIDASVTLICLHAADDGPVVSPRDPTRVRLDGGRPDPRLVVSLLKRAVSVQHRRWVARLLAEPAPAAWKQVAQLRHARALTFDADGRATAQGTAIELHPELGLVLTPQEAPS